MCLYQLDDVYYTTLTYIRKHLREPLIKSIELKKMALVQHILNWYQQLLGSYKQLLSTAGRLPDTSSSKVEIVDLALGNGSGERERLQI